MIKSEVIEIGAKAVSKDEPMVILFDETASPRLREVSVIQRFENDAAKNYDLKIGSKIQIVESNLTTIGHTVLNFKPVPEKEHLQENVLYLEPHTIPVIKQGTQIIYG